MLCTPKPMETEPSPATLVLTEHPTGGRAFATLSPRGRGQGEGDEREGRRARSDETGGAINRSEHAMAWHEGGRQNVGCAARATRQRSAERGTLNAERGQKAPAQASARSSFIIHHSSFPSAFTLIELMATIVIIAILATMFLAAFASAQSAAKKANTQALIAKLHGQLMLRLESYRTRRLPINTTSLSSQQAAIHRLNAMRELMRMELPDRYADLMANPGNNPLGLPATAPIALTSVALGIPMLPTAINQSYQRRVNSNNVNGVSTVPTSQYEDAECLYLIITTGLADDSVSSEQINPQDVGDADGDGMPEFHDAWGNPIRFIRWAPGFVSDFQPATPDSFGKHDPFDPLKMQHPFDPSNLKKNDLQTNPSIQNAYDGIALYPLIYSAGPDGIGDIQRPHVDSTQPASKQYAFPSSNWTCKFSIYTPTPSFPGVYDPYIVGASLGPTDPSSGTLIGGALDENLDGDSSGWVDNIHNHLIGQ